MSWTRAAERSAIVNSAEAPRREPSQSLDAPFAFRAGFLTITASLASYLRRLTVQAEIALQDRLVELQRLYADLAGAHHVNARGRAGPPEGGTFGRRAPV